MGKHRRGESRVLFAVPSGATNLPPPTAQTPRLIFGSTASPQPLGMSPPLSRNVIDNPSTMTPPQSLDAPPTATPLPQDVIDNIIDHLRDKPLDLRVCSLVAKSWKLRSQSHLFREVLWTGETVLGWCKRIPPRSDGLAGHAMALVVTSLLEQDLMAPIKDHFVSFRNVTSLTLQYLDFDDPLFNPNEVPVYFDHIKQGLTSLTLMNLNGSCGRLLSFVSFFPRLDYLAVFFPGDLVPPDPTIDLKYRPLRGTLFLRGHLNRNTNLIKLLSRAPRPQCHTIRLEHWGRMHIEDFNSLLTSCSKSLEILSVSSCKEEPLSRLRPNFSLCPRLTELRVELQNIQAHHPNLLNTLLTSSIVLSRITFVIHGKVEPENIIPSAGDWFETDIMIAQFSTKLFCRNGGKRLLLTFRVIRALDFTPLIPYSIKKGVEVAVEKDDDKELASQLCVSCKLE